ncbi:hypothetical protein B0I37DRAFT_166577 [Chaetomium sp. MPI-CAGE-AT-0009]|nr:hypothetical protein B0I37DRAFT_166577 [Chaetomium sp. MPI-CAGE-AT-0009]
MPDTSAASLGRVVLPHVVAEDGSLSISALGGAMVTRVLPEASADKTREFHFDVTIHPDHPRLRGLPKPPTHFHPYQEEYITILQGALGVELEGVEHLLRPGDAEFVIGRGVNHRLCFPSGEDSSAEPIRFYVSGERTATAFSLDLTFFENWYGYQEEVVVQGKKLDMIQLLSVWDAGDSYLTLPWWVPFRSTVSLVMGVVVGRWIGGLLGYQPFHRCWTTDWDLACAKMETSVFQRRFADRAKTA